MAELIECSRCGRRVVPAAVERVEGQPCCPACAPEAREIARVQAHLEADERIIAKASKPGAAKDRRWKLWPHWALVIVGVPCGLLAMSCFIGLVASILSPQPTTDEPTPEEMARAARASKMTTPEAVARAAATAPSSARNVAAGKAKRDKTIDEFLAQGWLQKIDYGKRTVWMSDAIWCALDRDDKESTLRFYAASMNDHTGIGQVTIRSWRNDAELGSYDESSIFSEKAQICR